MDRRNFIKAAGGALPFLVPGALSAVAPPNERMSRQEYLDRVQAVIEQGPYNPTLRSLENYTVPEWYKEAKFGIFIHWGVYSVPAHWNEWYPREMYRLKNPMAWTYHRLKYGPHDEFGYKDFIPEFTGKKFDAGRWADLFKSAGARYVVPVAEHHDGFAMYDSSFTKWKATNMGPGRDIIGELQKATRDRGLWFGLSSHRASHWWYFEGGRKFESDVQKDRYQSLYGPARPRGTRPSEDFMKDWLARSAELVDLYKPHLFYFDFGISQKGFEPYRLKLAAYYYNRAAERNQEVVLNYKNDAFSKESAVLDHERSGVSGLQPRLFQTDTSISYISWGYVDPVQNRWKNARRLISDLIETVSKNGVLLLNVGPKPDGTIPEPEQEALREMGRWLDVNGEAIYGTRPWKVFGEGPTHSLRESVYENLGMLGEHYVPSYGARDIMFTTKGDRLFAIVMGWPANGKVKIETLSENSGHAQGSVSSVRLLGHENEIRWERNSEALYVFLPEQKPCDHAFVIEVRGF